MTLAERILIALAEHESPLDDDQLASQLGVIRQAVNQTCRSLAGRGLIVRGKSLGGKIVNRLADPATTSTADQPEPPPDPVRARLSLLGEDEVKVAIRDHLEADGWTVSVAWGRSRGVDVEARRQDERLLLEAKAEVERNAQQVNYFLGALGELIQRMSDPQARYGLVLPDNRQYRGLAARLPGLAVDRLDLELYFVARDGDRYCVERAR